MTIINCEVCLEQFNSSNHKPLVICSNGHTICSACRSRVSTCPTCRARCSSRHVTNTALLTARDSLVSFKFLLLGESGVGKSSLLMRFTGEELHVHNVPTVGLDYKVKMMDLLGFSVKLCVWDTAGQEKFTYMTSTYYRGSHAVLLVYDISSRLSFEKLSHWVMEETRFRKENNTVKMVVGNKSDLTEERTVTYSEGKEWAEQRGFQFMEVSAVSGSSVNAAFTSLVQTVLQKPDVWDKKEWERKRIERLQAEVRNINRGSGCCR